MPGIRRHVGLDTKRHILIMGNTTNMGPTAIAQTLGVSRGLVHSVRNLVDTAGDVQRSRTLTGRPSKLNALDLAYLEGIIERTPDTYLVELQDALLRDRGIFVHCTNISRSLKRRGFTRKRVSRMALERDEDLRAQYQMFIATHYTPAQLVFVDEAGCNRNTTLRGWAWAPIGDRARRHDFFARGVKYSVLPAISLTGVLHLAVLHRSFCAVDFNEFIDGLLDNMNPFPGPNSVIVMDNASIHKSADLRPMIEARGMRLAYLSPYSPDFDPIEEGFSAMKAYIRRNRD